LKHGGVEIDATTSFDWSRKRRAPASFFQTSTRHNIFDPPRPDQTNKIVELMHALVKMAAPDDRINRRKQATLYDAVAGRVGYEGFLGEDAPTKYRDTVSRSNIAIPPDEVLFRRRGAPVRYEEDDMYTADRHLGPQQRLPDSDLLKTIHAYASDFYANATPDGGKRDFKSLDETALLAMGILLEEAAAESLGKTGDLALVEDAREEEEALDTTTRPGRNGNNTLKRSVVERPQSVQSRSRSRSVKRQRSGSLPSTWSRSST
jgi:hypothetical protein